MFAATKVALAVALVFAGACSSGADRVETAPSLTETTTTVDRGPSPSSTVLQVPATTVPIEVASSGAPPAVVAPATSAPIGVASSGAPPAVVVVPMLSECVRPEVFRAVAPPGYAFPVIGSEDCKFLAPVDRPPFVGQLEGAGSIVLEEVEGPTVEDFLAQQDQLLNNLVVTTYPGRDGIMITQTSGSLLEPVEVGIRLAGEQYVSAFVEFENGATLWTWADGAAGIDYADTVTAFEAVLASMEPA